MSIKVNDRLLHKLIRLYLKHGGNFVDVGAHLGSFVRTAVETAPNNTHHIVEPTEWKVYRLREEFPMTVIHFAAAYSSDGEKTFWECLEEPTYSSLVKEHVDGRGLNFKETKVRVIRLDSILPSNYQPTIIKIDVEGAETEVLKGAKQTITVCKPIIHLERHRQTSMKSVIKIVKDYSMQIVTFKEFIAKDSRFDFREIADIRDHHFIIHP